MYYCLGQRWNFIDHVNFLDRHRQTHPVSLIFWGLASVSSYTNGSHFSKQRKNESRKKGDLAPLFNGSKICLAKAERKVLKKYDNSIHFQYNMVRAVWALFDGRKEEPHSCYSRPPKEIKQPPHRFPYGRQEKIATSILTHLLCLAVEGDNDVPGIGQGAIK